VKIPKPVVLVALSSLLAGTLAAAQPDPVLDAMRAELTRSMTLTLNQLDKPYYLSYTVDDEHAWSAAATLGGLVNASSNNFRLPRLRIRVGDYKFDNTNGLAPTPRGRATTCEAFPSKTKIRWFCASFCGSPPIRRLKVPCSRLRARELRCATSR